MSDTKLIPANVMRMLGPEAGRSNEEAIIDYLISEPGAVALTEEQQRLLDRASFADDQMRRDHMRSVDLVTFIARKFGVSEQTAWRDIARAKQIFGSTRPTSKNYLLALHIERIQDAIQAATKRSDTKVLPKLLDTMTRAILALPEEKAANTNPPMLVFNFNLTGQELFQGTMDEDQAQAIALEMMRQDGITDIPFESVSDDDSDTE